MKSFLRIFGIGGGGGHAHGIDILGATGHGKPARIIDHRAVIQRAASAGARAVASGQKAIAASKAVAVAAPTLVKGAVMLGLVTPSKSLTPKQAAAVKKHDDAVARQKAAASRAAVAGQKAADAAKSLGKVVTTHGSKLAAIKNRPPATKMAPPQTSRVHGDDVMGDDEYGEGVELAIGDDAYDVMGATDAASMKQPYNSVPGGGDLTVPGAGVPYDGSFGLPGALFMSWNILFGGGDGFFWDGKKWWARRGGKDSEATDEERNHIPEISASYGWGPLIGDPKNPDLGGLRWAKNDKKWFWLREDAPAWSTKEADDAAALLDQQTQAAIAAANAADQAAADKAAADQAAAQAAQDAANALAESAAQSQANVADMQAQSQQQQLDLQAQQQQLARQAAYDQWAAANPDAAYGPGGQMPMYPDGGGDDEWGGGPSDFNAIDSALEDAVHADLMAQGQYPG